MPPKQTPVTITQAVAATPVANAEYKFGDFIQLTSPTQIDQSYLETQRAHTTPLVNYINDTLDFLPFWISDVPNDYSGRRAVAKMDLPAGTTIICEETPLWVVAGETISSFCHTCSRPLVGIAKPLMDQTGMYYFCSQPCQLLLERVAQIEAPIATNYSTIINSISIDIDLLRLSIRYLIQKYLNACNATMITHVTASSSSLASQKISKKTYPQSQSHLIQGLEVIRPTITEIQSLQGHFQHENDRGIAITGKTVIRTIYPILTTLEKGLFLPKLYPFDQDYGTTGAKQEFYYKNLEADLLGITSRINANIHSLQTYPVEPSTSRPQALAALKSSGFEASYQYGMGLFPIGAMFNHSCQPNCSFLNQGNVLCTRTITPIKKGEELLVNYVSLNSDLFSRRYHLLQEKGFWCQCRRCTGELSLEQITLSSSLDSQVNKSTTTASKTPANNKAAANAKAALAAKQKLQGKTPPAAVAAKPAVTPPTTTTTTTTTTPTSNADPKIYSTPELYEEQLSQTLFETFIGNSIFSKIVTLIEDAQVIPRNEANLDNLRDVDLNSSIDTLAGHKAHTQVSSNAITFKKHLLFLGGWYDKNVQKLQGHEIVELLSTQADELSSMMKESGKQFRTDFESLLPKQKPPTILNDEQQVVETGVEDETIPETTTSPATTPTPKALDILTKQSATKFITRLNAVYTQGLEFPHFKPFDQNNKNKPPMFIADYYPTLQDNLTFYPTQKQLTETTTTSSSSSQYRTYIIMCIWKLFEEKLAATLQIVQSEVPFAHKHNMVEILASQLYATYPLSLYHNQYQIIVLLSNIMTASCPNVSTPPGMTFFIAKLMAIYKVMHFLSTLTLPTHFMGFLDSCHNVLKAVAKAESILLKNVANPVAKTLQKVHSMMLTTLKNNAKKRLDAVSRVNYGADHIQTQAMQ